MNKEQIIKELSKLNPASTFMTLHGYRNDHSEVSDYSIIFHMSYENALKKSLAALKTYIPLNELEAQAKTELVDGYEKSLINMANTSIEDLDDNYTRFFDKNKNHIKGIKLHTETDTLHLYGLVAHKKVIVMGDYPKTNRRPLTLAKDKLRKMCPVSKFRQFKILSSNVDFISVNNMELLPPDEK